MMIISKLGTSLFGQAVNNYFVQPEELHLQVLIVLYNAVMCVYCKTPNVNIGYVVCDMYHNARNDD